MNLNLNLKLTPRLIVSILVPAVLLLGLTQAYLGTKSFDNAKKNGIEKATSISHEISAQVESFINNSFESVTVLKNSMAALSETQNPSRSDANLIMEKVLNSKAEYLAVWHMFEKNAFDNNDAQYKNNPLYKLNDGRYSITFYKDNNRLVNELARLEQYNEDYYTIPQKNRRNTLLEPYYYSYVGDTTNQVFETSVIVPFFKGNSFQGVMAVDIELSVLGKIIKSNKIFDTGFASIITHGLNIASHPDSSLVTQNLFSVIKGDTIAITQSVKKGREYYVIDNENGKNEVLRFFSPIKISGTNTPWSVMVEVPMKEVTKEARNLIIILITFNFIGVIMFILIVVFISRSITKPILKAADYVNTIARGDLTQNIQIKQRDEIGIMSENLKNMTNKLRLVVSDIVSNAENINLAGSELSKASQQLSEGANEQAASTEEVSSSMEEMVSNINQNADNARQTEIIASQAARDIEEGSKAVLNTLEAMRKIAEKISIVGIIAEKTDLLAINAAIEAARAGEHGKGFAVVATEVRKLAERSQNAAKEIDELSKTSVRIADESGKVLMKIIPDIQKTSLLVQEISAASMEMNSGANQINNAIMQLNTVTQRNATASEEISSSAEELVGQSEALKDVVAFFKTGFENSGKPAIMNSRNANTINTEKEQTLKKTNKQPEMDESKLNPVNIDLNDSNYEQY